MSIQIENENYLRKYPLSEDATGLSDSGSEIPYDVIVGLSVTTYVALPLFRISSIYVGPGIISVVLSDSSGVVATASGEYDSVAALKSMRDGVFGTVEFGHASFDSPMKFRFSSFKQSSISEFCVLSFPRVGVYMLEDASSGETATGSVEFDFGGQVSTTVSSTDDGTDIVTMELSQSAKNAIADRCMPTSLNDSCVSPVIQTINGMNVNSDGEFAVVFE